MDVMLSTEERNFKEYCRNFARENVSRSASMAKFYATEAAFQVVDQAVQIHGGIGVLQGSVVERLYRL